MKPIRLGIVSPCYNEQDVLIHSSEKLTELLKLLSAKGKIADDSFVLYINDGSRDETWNILCDLYHGSRFINVINLAHNVGHQNALMAGMMTAREICDGVVTVDCDLQDDIAAIEKMIDLYYEGNDIVYGVKKNRKVDSFFKKLSAQTFYKLQHFMGVNAVYNHADFRFMSKRALNALADFPERNLYLRGLIPMIGFKTATVDDVISERLSGKSKYTLAKMLRLAFDGITSFSVRPIILVLGAGIMMLFFSFCVLIYVTISLMTGKYVPGWSSLMLSVWFIGSIITTGIGICGAYIGKVYAEVKARPLYIIQDTLIHDKHSLTE